MGRPWSSWTCTAGPLKPSSVHIWSAVTAVGPFSSMPRSSSVGLLTGITIRALFGTPVGNALTGATIAAPPWIESPDTALLTVGICHGCSTPRGKAPVSRGAQVIRRAPPSQVGERAGPPASSRLRLRIRSRLEAGGPAANSGA